MAKKIIRMDELNRLTGQYRDESNIPYSPYKYAKYKELAEFNAELKPYSPSYGTNQLVSKIDVQPKIEAFSGQSVFTYIYHVFTDGSGNGGTNHFFNLGDYTVNRISKDYLGYNNIHISCQKSEDEWNSDPDDIYQYLSLALVFTCPYVAFSSSNDASTVVKLINLSYKFDDKPYEKESFTFRKLKTIETGKSDILNEIDGKQDISSFTYTEAENVDETKEGTGYVIFIDNFPFKYPGYVDYSMTIEGTLLYEDGTTGDFTHKIILYF